jgi:hypothetical protein
VLVSRWVNQNSQYDGFRPTPKKTATAVIIDTTVIRMVSSRTRDKKNGAAD